MWLSLVMLNKIFRGRFDEKLRTYRHLMFFNGWIGLINETYLFLCVCTCINFYYFNFDTYGNVINSILTLVFAFLLIAFPFYVACFYSLNSVYCNILAKDRDFFAKYG